MKPKLALALPLLAILIIASISLSHPLKLSDLIKLFKPVKVVVKPSAKVIDPELAPPPANNASLEPLKPGREIERLIAKSFGPGAELLALVKRAGYLEALVNASGAYYSARIEGGEVVSVVELKPILIEERTYNYTIVTVNSSYPPPSPTPFFAKPLIPPKEVREKYFSGRFVMGPLRIRKFKLVPAYLYPGPIGGGCEYVYAEYPVAFYNLWGWKVWELVARSITFISDLEVIDVRDESYYWISWWAQGFWKCDWFHSTANYNSLRSVTRADASFVGYWRGGMVTSRFAFAIVETWWDGSHYGYGEVH